MSLTRRQVLGMGGGLIAALSLPPMWANGRTDGRIDVRADEAVVEIMMAGRPDGSKVWFDPVGVHVRPGQVIRWVNRDAGNSHTATAYHPDHFAKPRRIPKGANAWHSGYLLPGESFSVRLTKEGIYDYYCVPHELAGMVGRIIVGDPGRKPGASGGSADKGLPEAALRAFPPVEEIMDKGIIRPSWPPMKESNGLSTAITRSETAPAVSPDASDEDLVRLARTGREDAVRLLVQRYNQQLFRTARGLMRNDADAEDVVQEAYVNAFTRLDTFRGQSRFGTWLTRIVLNAAYGRLRGKQKTVDLAELEGKNPADQSRVIMFPTVPRPDNPENETGREQVRHVLEQSVDKIPEPFRMVFILRDIQGFSVAETAKLLSIKPETVKTRLYRARRLMRGEIEKALAPKFLEVFPFGGTRCARMTERVIARLREA